MKKKKKGQIELNKNPESKSLLCFPNVQFKYHISRNPDVSSPAFVNSLAPLLPGEKEAEEEEERRKEEEEREQAEEEEEEEEEPPCRQLAW